MSNCVGRYELTMQLVGVEFPYELRRLYNLGIIKFPLLLERHIVLLFFGGCYCRQQLHRT